MVAKRSRRTAKIDDVIEINFLDHSEDSEAAVPCSVYGVLRKITPIEYVVYSWYCHDPDIDPTQHKKFTILRSAVKTIKILA